jgi:hypothetical protein
MLNPAHRYVPEGKAALRPSTNPGVGKEASTMDGSRFDQWARWLVTRSDRRGVLAASVAALAGATLATESGTAKKNNKNENTRKVCVCGTDGTVGSCQTKKVKADKVKKLLRSNPCASKGACQGRNPCATQTPAQTPSGCTPNCDRKVCGDDGCGGRCGTCSPDLVCADGRCASSCPGGQKVCDSNCIPNNQCCTNRDCPASSPTCCGGACLNVLTDERNCGTCGTRCSVNEHCVTGACRCGANGTLSCPPGTSCCGDSCWCESADGNYLNPLTCTIVQDCALSGLTACDGTIGGACGDPSNVCCPAGTTCSAVGTCLIV